MRISRSSLSPTILPRLPVPELRKTLDKYLKSLEPFLLENEANGGPTFHSAYAIRAKWADEFESGLGRVCQERLITLDRASPNNWLDDNFWLKKAYLEWREPLLINSNWWLAFSDDSQLAAKFRNERAEGWWNTVGCTPWQVKRAAWLLHRVLEFKIRLNNQEIHPDTTRTGVWLRDSVEKMFNIARIPRPSCDILSQSPVSNPNANQVIVMVHGFCYKITALSSNDSLLGFHDLERRILGVVRDVEARISSGEKAFPVGVLSADSRNTWAKNLQHLLDLSPINRATHTALVDSIMAISLETTIHSVTRNDAFQQTLDEHLHTIRGTHSNVSNRFFDKPFTLIVDPAARAGATGEHSACDALVPSIVAEYGLVQELDGTSLDLMQVGTTGWERLDWVVDDALKQECKEAQARADKIIEDSDTSVLWFTKYGNDWIKDTAKLSPDAYIQMALQLAWYRTHGEFTATYETVLTRMFNKGRTETLRTFTRDSRAFVLGMCNPHTTNEQKANLLRRAVQTHTSLTRDAATGRGIDRHLLGLRLVLQPEAGEHINLFEDPMFQQSSEWKLSTSGLSAGLLFRGTGFGAAYNDGYGINYLAAPDMVKFGIESKFSSPLTSTELFKASISEAMLDLKGIFIPTCMSDVEQILSHL
ncbi:acyltransferase ChoActase/COT/CPT [Mycena floridula]|nr:acyltransferase ChoActase/COT/CPT [Mycena floridula]